MQKEKVLSFGDMLNFVNNNSVEFKDLIDACRKVHLLVFGYNSARTFDAENKDKLADLEKQIDSESEKVIEKIKIFFDCDNLEFTKNTVFNEIIMPLSEVKDK